MKFKNIIPIILMSIILSSCKEDFFEATVNVDIPEHTPALAITSEMFAGDSTIAVYVTNSVSILEDINPEPIKNATVELFKDGQAFATLPYFEEYFETKFYLLELDEPFPSEMATYELKVSAPDYETITAVQTMPEAVGIISAEYDPDGAVNSEGDRVNEFTIKFQDPPGVENYYRLEIWQEDVEPGFGYSIYLENLEPLGEEYEGSLYLKDSSIDGKEYSWRVGSYSGGFGGGLFRIELYSITRDQYLFARSASLSEEADDNPFAEPVIVHGNVEGGNGIFSLGTKDVLLLEP